MPAEKVYVVTAPANADKVISVGSGNGNVTRGVSVATPANARRIVLVTSGNAERMYIT